MPKGVCVNYFYLFVSYAFIDQRVEMTLSYFKSNSGDHDIRNQYCESVHYTLDRGGERGTFIRLYIYYLRKVSTDSSAECPVGLFLS